MHPDNLAKRPTPESSDVLAGTGRKVQCRFSERCGGGFTDEMSRVLRTRLRLAILIILGAFVLHWLRNALNLPGYEHRSVYLILSSIQITVMAVGSAVLWSRRPLSMTTLRALECIIFAMVAAFFAWLQFDTYHDGTLLQATNPGHEVFVFRLVGLASALRWFLLIVLYGVFIPNTWQRCTAVVGILASLPIVIMLVGTAVDSATASYVLSSLPELIILMLTASAIAVFGSYKIGELHAKAHEAKRIGQYRLKEILGFGGMGAVYLAEHVLLRRPCAIKLIRADQAGDPQTLIRFEREVTAAAKLTHWNTIEIFDYGHTDDGTFYYVMEYLPGMNLEEMVERHGAMPPERAVHLVRQVCQALREAHGQGIIHRDVKPSNIIACERGKVYDVAKLLDFGLVKSVGPDADAMKLTRDGVFAGSPAFMSPEQAAGREHLDARSDIYNVGAVAYFLLTGKLLFDRTSPLQMLHAHASEIFVPSHEFEEVTPLDLQAVITRCLQKDPARRYQDAGSLDRALAECESSGRWTADQAEEWWQHHSAEQPAPSQASQAVPETQIISVAR
jgi:hypothetical protein